MTVADQIVAVRYYVATDTYYYATCNRPLTDLTTNVATLAYYLDLINEGYQAIVCLDEGGANALNPTSSQFPSVGELTAGITITFAVAATNTASTTAALNDFPPSLVYSEAGPLQGGELVAGSWVILSWSGSFWLLVANSEGSFPAAPGVMGNQPILLGQLQDGVMNLTLSSVSLEELTGQNLTAETIAVGNAELPENAINFSQLSEGLAVSATTIDWTEVLTDTPLQVGQTASYTPSGIISSFPLNIACGDGQIYEIDIYQLLPYGDFVQGTGLDLQIQPNNTSYSGMFEQSSLENSFTNQGQFYEPISATPEYGITTSASSSGSSFYMDDVNGSAAPPYHRRIKIYTGNVSLGVPKVLCSIGGGGSSPAVSGANNTTGTNITGSVWNDTLTPYTSLGSISSSASTSFVCFVRRVF